jgi:hypothetical protein
MYAVLGDSSVSSAWFMTAFHPFKVTAWLAAGTVLPSDDDVPYLHDVGWPEKVTKSTTTESARPDGEM